MPNAVDLVTSRFVPLVLRRVQLLNLPTASLLSEHSLAREAIELDSVRMTLGSIAKLSDQAAVLAQDPAFGITLARTVERGYYGLLEFVLRSAETLKSGLEVVMGGLGLPDEPIRFRSQETPSALELHQSFLGERSGMGRHGNTFSLALILRIGRESVKEPIVPRRVWFCHSAPPDLAPVERFFGTQDIRFDADDNGFSFDLSVLTRQPVAADSGLHRALKRELEARSPPSAARALRDKVKEVSLELIGGGREIATVEKVARRLGLSSRSLQRELEAHDTSFRAILDDCRAFLSQRYLLTADLDVSEVAARLGFSDGRTFARAFRRWTGQSPGAFRSARSGS